MILDFLSQIVEQTSDDVWVPVGNYWIAGIETAGKVRGNCHGSMFNLRWHTDVQDRI